MINNKNKVKKIGIKKLKENKVYENDNECSRYIIPSSEGSREKDI
jgi:hypothetical protein